jgi:hypothetical protein
MKVKYVEFILILRVKQADEISPNRIEIALQCESPSIGRRTTHAKFNRKRRCNLLKTAVPMGLRCLGDIGSPCGQHKGTSISADMQCMCF